MRAAPLSADEIGSLDEYFKPIDLGRVRVVVADPLPITEPPFSNVLRSLGFDFPSVALTAAITFDDVVASRERMSSSILFHELVHVVQYRLLGVSGFAEQYVRGFLESGSYHKIPLEVCAFTLERRAMREGRSFCVERAVEEWMG